MAKKSDKKSGGKGKSKAPGLSGLAAAFASAGLVSQRDAERAEREKRKVNRREDKSIGRRQARARDERGKQDQRASLQVRADADRDRAKVQIEGDARDRAVKLIKAKVVGGGGSKRWFFVARSGQVPFLGVSDGTIEALSKGRMGIVESLGAFGAAHVVVDRDALGELKQLDPGIVRFWNS